MARRKQPPAPELPPPSDDVRDRVRDFELCGCGNLMYGSRFVICRKVCPPSRRFGGATADPHDTTKEVTP